MANYPRFKLTGYKSASKVDEIFSSAMVDVAYVDEITEDCIFVIADEPKWFGIQHEYDWLCMVITETLVDWGVPDVKLEFVPADE